MKNHNGMRPQDIVILLKLSILDSKILRFSNIAEALFISASEVSESLERSRMAGLVSEDKREVYKESLIEFLQGGLKYVFPAIPGSTVRGMPTACIFR
jgi:predicted transcriptional regulator